MKDLIFECYLVWDMFENIVVRDFKCDDDEAAFDMFRHEYDLSRYQLLKRVLFSVKGDK